MYSPGIIAFVRTLGLVGAFPTRATSRERLLALMERLHPVHCGRTFVRLGGREDGGYLVPDDLEGITTCCSAGVGRDSRFELDCAERGMEVFLADGSVAEPASTDLPPLNEATSGATIPGGDAATLPAWMASVGHVVDELLLKLDIEGTEYEVFLAAPETLLARCRIVVVEFHQLDHLWSEPFFRVASRAFDKLLSSHACVHIHPNNHDGVLRHRGIDIPPTMEFTFLRRDRLPDDLVWRADFPHPLDRDNTRLPEVRLPRCWHR